MTTTQSRRRIVVGMSGSSAPQLGVALLQAVHENPAIETHLVVSEGARVSLRHEMPEMSLEQITALADVVHDNRDLAAAIASGSFRTDGMVIAPCSMNTLGTVAHSLAPNLLARAADVTLKERRRLVLVARESPLHKGHIENLLRVTEMGAIVCPPVVAFYHRPKSIDDILRQIVGKVLDLLDVEHALFTRWNGGSTSTPGE